MPGRCDDLWLVMREEAGVADKSAFEYGGL